MGAAGIVPDDPAKPDDAAGLNTTILAVQRNIMANERTFSAWLRTGLALVVAAIALPRIIHFVSWAWTLKLIGFIFILIASAVFLVAYWRYEAESKKLAGSGMVNIRWPI